MSDEQQASDPIQEPSKETRWFFMVHYWLEMLIGKNPEEYLERYQTLSEEEREQVEKLQLELLKHVGRTYDDPVQYAGMQQRFVENYESTHANSVVLSRQEVRFLFLLKELGDVPIFHVFVGPDYFELFK